MIAPCIRSLWNGKEYQVPRKVRKAVDARPYGHVMVVDAEIICVPEIDPTLGALGFAGAHAMIGLGYWPATGHRITKGSVLSMYCDGGGARDQKTGKGLTEVGGDENIPVAVN
jgi:hypothetical protein